jgi:hypothetical protein
MWGDLHWELRNSFPGAKLQAAHWVCKLAGTPRCDEHARKLYACLQPAARSHHTIILALQSHLSRSMSVPMAPTAAAVAFTSDSSCEVEGAPIEPAKQSLQHGQSMFSSAPNNIQHTPLGAAVQAACTL